MTTASTEEFPSFNDELGRKAIGVLSDFIAKNEAGEVSDQEMKLITGALFDTVSGLIPWSEADVLSQTYNHFAGVPVREKR